MEEVLHWPYLKGLSASTVSRCPCLWEQEHEEWNSRNLQKNRYVYFWADGVYFNIRSDDARQCILVIVGVTEQSWTELLLRLRAQGLKQVPRLGVGDGALGFWEAMDKVYPDARHQRCRVHKTANVLNKLPQIIQPQKSRSLFINLDGPDKRRCLQGFQCGHFDIFRQVSESDAVSRER